MKKILVVLSLLASNLCFSQIEAGESVIIIAETNIVRVGERIVIKENQGEITIGQENSRITSEIDPVSIVKNGGPGVNIIKGRLSSVSPQGEGWYWVTCLPSDSNCIIYFIKY